MRAVVLLVLALAACGGGATSDETTVDASSSDTTVATTDTNIDDTSDSAGDATTPAPRCAAAASACTKNDECCSSSCVSGKCQMLGAASLDDDRDRVLETYAGVKGVADRCAAWSALNGTQKGIFLTHTDMLGNRSCMENGGANCAATADQAFAHVFKLWAINGSDPSCSCTITSTGYKCCNGGGEFHRIYFSADDLLIQYLRNVSAGLPEWGPSKDLAGPHDPFTQSDETATGSPRGQVHFWAKVEESKSLTRNGVNGVTDSYIVELDNDYNIVHDSNPEGCYGVFGIGCSYGRAMFKKSWSDKGNRATTTFRGNGEPSAIPELASDAIYAPRCPTARVTSVSPPRPDSVVTLTGTGFTPASVVHFRTRAGETVLSGPFIVSASSTELRVHLPAESTLGEAYAWVVVDGVLSNLVPVTIGKLPK